MRAVVALLTLVAAAGCAGSSSAGSAGSVGPSWPTVSTSTVDGSTVTRPTKLDAGQAWVGLDCAGEPADLGMRVAEWIDGQANPPIAGADQYFGPDLRGQAADGIYFDVDEPGDYVLDVKLLGDVRCDAIFKQQR